MTLVATRAAKTDRADRRAIAKATDDPAEDAIQIALIEHLQRRAKPGVWWHHSPNGGKRDKRTGAKFKRMGTQAGAPDLQFVQAGVLTFLELKRASGVLSVDQKRCHLAIANAGAIVLVAYGLDQALALLSARGLIRSAANPASKPGVIMRDG
jgi:hypothetical protein